MAKNLEDEIFDLNEKLENAVYNLDWAKRDIIELRGQVEELQSEITTLKGYE